MPDPLEPEAIAGLFEAHQERVYAICHRFVGQPELARDLAQDTLLTAFQKLPEFRGDADFGTWLYGIARNKCLNALRRRRDLLVEDGVLPELSGPATELVALEQREREQLLGAVAAEALSPMEQQAVYLRYVEGLPQDRITVLLGIEAASGARGVLQACRRRLRQALRRRLAELGHGSSFVHELPT